MSSVLLVERPKIDTVPHARLRVAKAGFTTRRVPSGIGVLLAHDAQPRVGDVVLARVDEIGQHGRLERPDGRRARLFAGDEILVCYGHRYSPDQFEATVPEDLSPCDLVAGGGVVARARLAHRTMREPTRVTPIGLLLDDDGEPVNVARWRLQPIEDGARPPLVIGVVGTSMNSGKTTAAAALVRGLVRAGRRVGAAKITGTGAGGDLWSIRDAGATPVLDFTDAGLPSTYLADARTLEQCLTTLVGHLSRARVDAAVIEIADGLLQRETVSLVGSAPFALVVDVVLFASGEALGAEAGVRWLRAHGLRVVGVSGVLTRSPLAVHEAERATGVPVLGPDELADPTWVTMLVR